jgi:DNA-binding transcriptional MerR regulator
MTGEGAGGPSDDAAGGRAKAKKAPSAFRTISEVADELHIPQHVLRFWETKFPQVKPLKRGGGRRYYRPDDITLLRRVSDLLYIQGYTIKGVQRLLREGGGKLSDDIPPPSPEDREAEELASPRAADTAEPEAAAAPEPSLPLFETLSPAAPGQTPPPSATASAAPRTTSRAAKPDHEVERLRALLAETLSELEALRALLR